MYINRLTCKYDNLLIIGDFNSEPSDKEWQESCNLYNLKNLVNEPTCYKNHKNPSCIDLIFTNRPRCFQNTTVVETETSDFHKMTITVMKTCFRKQPPKIISYRDYKHFSQPYFRYELEIALIQHNFLFIPNDKFVEITMELFNKHVPLKHKYIRANQSPFMTKELQKAIMHRSKLRNRANRTKSEADLLEYKKQRNLCTFLLRKAKKRLL